MNRKDRLKKVVLAAFGKNKIVSEAVSQCNEAIQNIMNKITITREIIETEAYNELKKRGLSEDKLPELISKISQRYSIKTIEDRRLLKMVAIKVYTEFLVDNLSQIETILRGHGYEGKIVKAFPIDESEFCTTNLIRFEYLLKKQGYEAKFVMATPINNPNACRIVTPIIPIYFGDYVIRPDKSLCFRVTMKCKGHQSKMVNVEFKRSFYEYEKD